VVPVTVTAKVWARAPEVGFKEAMAACVLVRVNTAGADTPLTLAVTWYEPGVVFAVKTAAVAMPLEFVVAVVTPPAKVPVAPEVGAAKVTVIPLTGLLPLSLTITWRFGENTVLTAALSVAPAYAVTDTGTPGVLVSEKLAGVLTPDTLAVTEYEPAVPFAVRVDAVATPLELVTAVLPLANAALAPVEGTANVTVAPTTGLLPLSRTTTWRFVENAVLMIVLCGVPAFTVMDAAAPEVLVRAKVAGVLTPDTLAVTLYVPVVELAVIAEDVATPLALVTAVLPLAKVTLAPELGTAKVTVTPLTGLFPESFTVTCSADPNAVLMTALCGVPAVAVMDAGVPTVFVRAKLAGVVTPDTLAVTA